jgi:hypothetical protein
MTLRYTHQYAQTASPIAYTYGNANTYDVPSAASRGGVIHDVSANEPPARVLAYVAKSSRSIAGRLSADQYPANQSRNGSLMRRRRRRWRRMVVVLERIAAALPSPRGNTTEKLNGGKKSSLLVGIGSQFA